MENIIYQQALADYEKALSPDHTSTLSTLKETEEMYQQALAGYEKVMGLGYNTTQGILEQLNMLKIKDRNYYPIILYSYSHHSIF
ncbi:uncharacterized protein N7483_007479 [Penicillium malachiteum]|uniref:uncharacterized protein n=1 Tax=Penicillium malachiteum TaxID=1324776 RepID=UPI002547AB9C|nr:uncharacterized protein N7483_007479 [Penicillium malachiteum]KAJ5726122.1 hypothetical protein N7483_007479 [Penicillium malachiteum]